MPKRLNDEKIKNLGEFGFQDPVNTAVEQELEEDQQKPFDLNEISRKIRVIEYNIYKMFILLENIETKIDNVSRNVTKIEEVKDTS